MIEQNAGTEGTNMGAKERSGGSIAAKSHEASEQLKDAVVDQVEHVRDKAESAKEQTAERIRRVASQLKSVGNTLRAEDEMASAVADRASRGVDAVATYVASTDLRGFVRDTERLARRQPALFFGSAFMLGLAVGRFLKNAPPEPSASDSPRRSSPPPREPANRTGAGTTQAGQQRYKENVDAAFGRDMPFTPAAGSSLPQRSSSSPATPRAGTLPAADAIPESNGGGQRAGRGKTS
jgi:hypothetical protein